MATIDPLRDQLAHHFTGRDLTIAEHWDADGRHAFEISGVVVSRHDADGAGADRRKRAWDAYLAITATLTDWGARIPDGAGWSLNVVEGAVGDVDAYVALRFYLSTP